MSRRNQRPRADPYREFTESKTLPVRMHRRLRLCQIKKGVRRASLESRQYCPSLSLPGPHPNPHVGRVKESFFLT